MGVLKKLGIALGAAILGVNLAYRYVLTEEQQADVRTAVDAVESAVQEVTDTVKPIVTKGPTRAEEEAAIRANQEQTAAQWEALGY